MFPFQWENGTTKSNTICLFYLPISVLIKDSENWMTRSISYHPHPLQMYTRFLPFSEQGDTISAQTKVQVKRYYEWKTHGWVEYFLFSDNKCKCTTPGVKHWGNICIPQVKKPSTSTIRGPPGTESCEQLAVPVKAAPRLWFCYHHTATLEVQPSSQCKYKNDQIQGFMAIFC